MIQTLYVSKATKPMSEDEILEILKQSRERNKEDSITGMLLYVKEKFFQILEGEESKVSETYERILKDERHTDIKLIKKFDIQKRVFPEWSMGFKYITEENMDEVEGYSDFLNNYVEPEDFTGRYSLAVKLLYSFRNREVGY
jgi:hypothetical protein